MRLAIACALMGLAALPGRAQIPQRSVLLVYSGERNVSGYSAVRNITGVAVIDATLERVLRDNLEGNLYYYSEFVDATRVADPSYAKAAYALLRSKYEGRKLDLIFVMGDVAVEFVSRHRADFFPATPIVFSTADPVGALANSTGIRTPIKLQDTLDMALRIQPETQHVAVVSGMSPYDLYYERAARDQFKPFEGRVAFTYLTGLPEPDLLRRVATLPARSIVLFLSLTQDGEGRLFLPQETLNRVSAAANVPTYSWSALGVDLGAVGGRMQSPELLATRMAEMGLRVLNGERAETIPVTDADWSTTRFDWRQLQRWSLGEDRLPADSTILFKPPSAWELYRGYILAAVLVVLFQSSLIAALLLQRRRRTRAERAVRESEGRFRAMAEQNQDLAGRLINGQEEERARIARDLHDDVSQQLAGLGIMLSSIKHKASQPEIQQALTVLQERAKTLAEAIRHLTHELHPSVLQHTGLVATLRRHCAEIQAHHPVTVTFNASGHFDALSPDVALCLFRVTQEALNNGVKHANAGRIDVRLQATADEVELSITDDGVGFVATDRARAGLGLRSMDERVRLAKGRFGVESRPGHGTRLHIRIPRAAVPAPIDAPAESLT